MTPATRCATRFVAAVAAAAFAASACAMQASAPTPDADRPLAVDLVARADALRPGASAQLGLRLRHAPHWHSYWINPGDSGLPTRVTWSLPPGYAAGELEWPLPRRFVVGSLQNFGYEGDIVLPVTLDVPADAPPGTRVRIKAEVKWLACREACIPGKEAVELELPIAPQPAIDARWSALFERAERERPRPVAWQGRAELDGERVRILLQGEELPSAESLDAYVVQRKLLDNRRPTFRRDADALVIEAGRSEYFMQAPERFDLVLTAPGAGGPRAWSVSLPLHDRAAATSSPPR